MSDREVAAKGCARHAPPGHESRLRLVARLALSGLFLSSGVGHFYYAPWFIAIVPQALPRPDLLVAISGIAELVLAVALFLPRARAGAAWLLLILMLAVWPANWNMALHAARFGAFTPLELWMRVLLQLPMLLWALYAGGVWPRLNHATARSESR